jgi:hypothetical protein
MALRQILDILGFGTPFVYAFAVYGFFHFLDRKASGQAKRAISSWCERRPYDKVAAVTALIETFDRIYTVPLFGWRAMARSALFSIVVTALLVFKFAYWVVWIGKVEPKLGRQWLEFFLYNITSDYISLFLIRFWLQIAGRRPLFALCVGAVLGFVTVFVVYIIIDVVTFSIMTRSFYFIYFWQDVWNWYWFIVHPGANIFFIGSAFLVHSWLLLFALGIVIVQLINSLRLATHGVQWFLKRGHDHPLQAIGYVAASFTLITAAIVGVLRAHFGL